jgi:uncharacterized protein YdcH (DUF465 family)
MNEEMIELATGLQHSNVREVSELAKAYLALKDEYIQICGENVMMRHEKLLKKLAESESRD